MSVQGQSRMNRQSGFISGAREKTGNGSWIWTKALVQCAEENLPLFFKPISELEVPLLLMGSAGDEMVRTDIRDEYEAISGKTGAEICMFSSGGHSAIYSNAERAAEAIRQFLNRADVRNDCNEIVIRPLKPEEYSVLEDFLYDAIYLPEGAAERDYKSAGVCNFGKM